MAANTPDMGAIAHLGGQFHHNIFEHAQKKLNANSKKYAAAHQTQVRAANANRERFASSAEATIKAGRAAFAKQQATQQKNATAAAKAHAQGVKSGRVAPAQGAPPRTFAMAPTPQAKAQQKASAQAASQQARTMQQQRNFAHGEALKFQAAQFKVKQQQVNNAHTEALKVAKQKEKGSPVNTTSAPKTPSMSPSFSNAPERHTPVQPRAIPATTFSSQFTPQRPLSGPQGSTTASFSSGPASHPTAAPQSRSGSVSGPQFPQHTHPEGSSTTPLPHLTASQPRPNTFTVGSRNARPGGLAARGSQLESWAIQRQAEVRKQRGSDNTQLRLGD